MVDAPWFSVHSCCLENLGPLKDMPHLSDRRVPDRSSGSAIPSLSVPLYMVFLKSLLGRGGGAPAEMVSFCFGMFLGALDFLKV